MLVHDYPVKEMSQDDIEHEARRLRAAWGVGKADVLDILELIENRAPTSARTRDLRLIERPDGYMGERDAYAISNKIFAKSSIVSQAKVGDGRARVVLGHELSHIILHPGAEKAWMTEGNVTPEFIEQNKSAEWQATALSLALFVPEEKGLECKSAIEISHQFKIDLEHAYIRFEVLARRKRRTLPAIYYSVKQELEKASERRPRNKKEYLDEICPSCTKATLIPIDNKYLCDTCGSVTDRFPDGDPIK